MAISLNLEGIIERELFSQALDKVDDKKRSEVERKIKSNSARAADLRRELEHVLGSVYNKLKEINRDLGTSLSDPQITAIMRDIVDSIKIS